MKQPNIYLVIILIAGFFVQPRIIAQVPQKLSYQAVIRNNNNELVTSKGIGIRISILKTSASGTLVYTETQSPTANANGVVSIEFGGGTGFDTINWASSNYFIKTEIDPEGGNDYSITGTSQLLSVPYAFYADKAGNQVSYTAGTGIEISGNTIKNTGDLSSSNEIQTISMSSGKYLSLSNGGGIVTLPDFIPVGTIVAYAGAVPPSGWLNCNGSEINRTTYNNLFSVIGISWGAGNLTTTFNLPDLRGRFLRGLSGSSNVDEDKTSRTALFSGGNTGNNVGTYQSENYKSHNHSGTTGTGNSKFYRTVENAGTSSAANHQTGWTGGDNQDREDNQWNNSDHNHNIPSDGGNETRPDNAAVIYIIKY
jgi:microcystin-dependent protein